MKIEFINSRGKILFSGGASAGRDTCFIVEVSGLGLAPMAISTVTWSGVDGQSTVSRCYRGRSIVISADIPRRSYDFEQFYGRFLRILEAEGELFVFSRRKKRRIRAYASSVSEGKSQGEWKRVVITFTCDSPYFTDIEKVSGALFTKNRYLATEFVLPLIISERINRTLVYNAGDIPAEPIIRFKNASDGADGSGGNLIIKNETTGKTLTLNYYPNPGCEVIIDISERSIVSSDGESLLCNISDDSDLSEFLLAVGENVLSVESNITNSKVHVEYAFWNCFVEGAVYGS